MIGQVDQPLIDWGWIWDHLDDVWTQLLQHIELTVIAVVVGFLISTPLALLTYRRRRWYPPVTWVTGLLYTIPSLALFILLPVVLGTRILDRSNVLVAMTIYTLALLVRTVADALGAVPEDVKQAATAMGFTRFRRFFGVELPLAVPVIAAGMRVAAVIGIPQLGLLFTDGFARTFYDPIVVGLAACVVLALAFDLVILAVARALTPWQRAGAAS